MKKRMISLALCLCLVLGMVPGVALGAKADTVAPQVSYAMGEAYKYTSESGISALTHGTDSPKTSTAICSGNGNVISMGTTGSTSSQSTNGKLIYVPVAVTVTVPANTKDYYVQHNIAASATRVVESTNAGATANTAVYYLGTADTSSEITFYPYSGGGDTKKDTDAKELGMACLGKTNTTTKTFTLDISKTIAYSNTTSEPITVTHYFGVMIVTQNASSYKNTMTGTFTFTAEQVHGHDGIVFDTPWTKTDSLPTTAGSYYLTKDITLNAIPAIAGNVDICLNGHTVNLNNFYIQVSGNLGIHDCSTAHVNGYIDSSDKLWKADASNAHSGNADECDLTGGIITGGNANSGGAFWITNTGSLRLTGGNIAGNKANNGGGVYCGNNGGKFTMTGGSIIGNTATCGAGVYVAGTFTMSGGSIVRNIATHPNGYTTFGGGVYVDDGGNFTMSGDSSITGNAAHRGSAVYAFRLTSNETVYESFTMTSGTISQNKASNGTVYITGAAFTMSGGSITNNTASNTGCGVYVSDTRGSFTMTNGTISQNTAQGSGTVYLDNATFTMSGGSITDNSAMYYGGVYAKGTGTFNMTGGSITDNSATNKNGGVSVSSTAMANLSGGSITGSAYGVYHDGTGGVYLSGTATISGTVAGIYLNKSAALHAQSSDTTPVAYSGGALKIYADSANLGDVIVRNVTDANKGSFSVTNDGYTLTQGTGDNAEHLVLTKPVHEHNTVSFTEWTATNSLPTTAGSYYLTADITAPGNLTIPSGATVDLCLNGHTVNMGSHWLYVEGTLNVFDCGTTGTISGAQFGIYNTTNGIVNIHSGTVQATGDGLSNNVLPVGIHNNGTVNIIGGTVTSVRTGIYNTGSSSNATISGGTVSGVNQGIHNASNATLTITGGTVEGTGNGNNYYGIYNKGTIHISGGTVRQITGIGDTVHGICNYGGTVYLSGTPTISGTVAGIYLYMANGAALHAQSSDTTPVAYSGGALKIYADRANLGDVIVRNVTDANKGSFSVTNDGYTLAQGSGDNAEHLVLAEKIVHTHNICGEETCTGHPDGVTHSETITYDKVLSMSADGYPYIDGVAIEGTGKWNTYYYIPSGNYYLASDCVPTATSWCSLYIAEGEIVNLCLSDYTIGFGSLSVYGTLNICTCGNGAVEGKSYGVCAYGGTINVYGGEYHTAGNYPLASQLHGTSGASANVTVYGGKFVSDASLCVSVSGSALTVYDGHFTGNWQGTLRISMTGTDTNVKIYGGTFTGTQNAIDITDNHYSAAYDHANAVKIYGGNFETTGENYHVLSIKNYGSYEPFCGVTADSILGDGLSWLDADGKVVDPTAVQYAKVAAAPETSLIEFFGTNMTLGNDLALNFALAKEKIPAGAAGYYAKLTRTYADGTTAFETTIPMAQWKDDGGSYYVFTYDGLAAKEMIDEVTVQIFDADNNAVSVAHRDSIRSYAMRMLGKTDTASDVKTLLVDMLNYGAAAQSQFTYVTTDPANAQLTDAQQALATQSVSMTNNLNKGAHYHASSLTLESNIVFSIAYKFTGVETNTLTATVSFTSHDGTQVSKEYTTFKVDGEFHILDIKDLVVADVNALVTITVKSGDTVVDTTVDSMASYLARMDSTSNNLYQSIMKFCTSAHAHFHPETK